MPKFVKSYRNKDKARITRNRQRQKNYAKTAIYDKREWCAWEEDLVMAHTISDMDLSALLERSVQSIQLKRWRIKKLQQTTENYNDSLIRLQCPRGAR